METILVGLYHVGHLAAILAMALLFVATIGGLQYFLEYAVRLWRDRRN